MKIDKTIVIAALARDCEMHLNANITRIEQLRAYYKQSYVVIYENDSVDSTVQILNQWSTTSNGVFIISENISKEKTIPLKSKTMLFPSASISRIKKMATFRNKLLTGIKNYINDVDYLLLLDIDIYSFDVLGVVESINRAPSDWGALFSNGTYYYNDNDKIIPFPIQYDYYAYIDRKTNIKHLSYYSLLPFPSFLRARFLSKKINSNPYYKAVSGFGGIAVYKYKLLEGLSYSPFVPDGWAEKGLCLCEHITINEKIQSNENSCYFSRSMRVNYGIVQYTGIKKVLFNISPSLLGLLSSIYDTVSLCGRIILSFLSK